MNHYITKTNQRFVVRAPTEEDAAGIIEYATLVFSSTDQVLTTAGEFNITADNERAWINSFNNNPASFIRVAENEHHSIIGLLFFAGHPKIKAAHTGEFGITVHPHWQGIGIGRKLVQELLDWAKFNNTIKKVSLQVFSTNTKAIDLYRSLGFMEEGRHVKGIQQPTGDYVDIIQMYQWVE